MQRSFSIVDEDDDDDFNNIEQESYSNATKYGKKIGQRYTISDDNKFHQDDDPSGVHQEMNDSDSDDNLNSDRNVKRITNIINTAATTSVDKNDEIMENHRLKPAQEMPQILNKHHQQKSTTSPHLNITGRQTVIKSRSALAAKHSHGNASSDSELDDDDDDNVINNSDNEGKKVVNEIHKIVGEYNAKDYENMDVNEQVKDIFQYINKYTPQHLDLDNKFKPFLSDYLPAVGDIDAFLKVIPPDVTLSGQLFDAHDDRLLGFGVLDEPAANQSDPALLHLQLRAASLNAGVHGVHATDNMIVKKVDNVEKNVKTINKWIKDISDLHKSKSSPTVKYSEAMPDLEELMQEWSDDKEQELKENGFPGFDSTNMSLSDYVRKLCDLFDIPSNKNQIQSLHLLFSLYATIKSLQSCQLSSVKENNNEEEQHTNDTNHLVLE